MKEKYLIDIKNAMFWHFSSREIKDTLEEVNVHFACACHSGLSEEEVINEYGRPSAVAKELRDEVNPIERKRKQLVILKGILCITCVFALYIAFSLCSLNTAFDIFVILSSVLLWFLSGNDCLIGVLPETRERRRDFVKNQIAVFLCVLFFHMCSLVIIPYIIISASPNAFIVRNIMLFIYFIIVSLFFITILYLRNMLHGNVYMFFVIVQNISLIVGLFLYISFLKNIESIDNINFIRFIFEPYFICLPVLVIYWLYIKRSKKNGCTD